MYMFYNTITVSFCEEKKTLKGGTGIIMRNWADLFFSHGGSDTLQCISTAVLITNTMI